MVCRGWKLWAVLLSAVALYGCRKASTPPPPPPPPTVSQAPTTPDDGPAPAARRKAEPSSDSVDPISSLALPPARALPPVDRLGKADPTSPTGKDNKLYGFKEPKKGFGLGGLNLGGGTLGGGALSGGGLGGLGMGGGLQKPSMDLNSLGKLKLPGKLGDKPPKKAAPTSRPTSQPTSRPAAPSSQPAVRAAPPTSKPADRDDPGGDDPGGDDNGHKDDDGHDHGKKPAARGDVVGVTPPKRRKPKPLPAVVARVNNEPIERDAFIWAFALHRSAWERQNGSLIREMIPEFRKKVLSRVIDEHLVYQRAVQQGIKLTHSDISAGMQAFKAQLPPGTSPTLFFMRAGISMQKGQQLLKRQLYLEKYKQTLMKGINVTLDTIKEFYKKHYKGGKAKASHIVVNVPAGASDAVVAKARKRATQIMALAKEGGANFAALARKYSDDSSASSGGSLGEVKSGDMIKALDELIFSMQTGQIGGPVRTPLGFHIVKVDFRRIPRSLRQVQAEIMRLLFQKKAMKMLEKEAKELRKEAQIEILVPWGKD